MFDCTRCERRAWLDRLDDANRDAWEVWLSMGTRLVKEFGLGPLLLARACEGRASEDVDDLVARLSVLYDTLCPVPQGRES